MLWQKIIIFAISLQSFGQNFTQWTILRDSLDRPVSCIYRLTAEMDTLNLGRRGFHGESPFDFKKEYDGFDRGHLVPSASSDYSVKTQQESFDMRNIVPQTPFLNRGLVKELERYERRLAEALGCVLVLIEVHYYETIAFRRRVFTCDLNKIIDIEYKN